MGLIIHGLSGRLMAKEPSLSDLQVVGDTVACDNATKYATF